MELVQIPGDLRFSLFLNAGLRPLWFRNEFIPLFGLVFLDHLVCCLFLCGSWVQYLPFGEHSMMFRIWICLQDLCKICCYAILIDKYWLEHTLWICVNDETLTITCASTVQIECLANTINLLKKIVKKPLRLLMYSGNPTDTILYLQLLLLLLHYQHPGVRKATAQSPQL